eukprot:SAG31_NODE_543_length_14248_cov_3.230900_7_plen_213_part_00
MAAARCTHGTGCAYDRDLLWTSTRSNVPMGVATEKTTRRKAPALCDKLCAVVDNCWSGGGVRMRRCCCAASPSSLQYTMLLMRRCNRALTRCIMTSTVPDTCSCTKLYSWSSHAHVLIWYIVYWYACGPVGRLPPARKLYCTCRKPVILRALCATRARFIRPIIAHFRRLVAHRQPHRSIFRLLRLFRSALLIPSAKHVFLTSNASLVFSTS